MGIKSVLGIHFSKEETNMFVRHLDEDKSGDIDMAEFMKKIHHGNKEENDNKILIQNRCLTIMVLFMFRENKLVIKFYGHFIVISH